MIIVLCVNFVKYLRVILVLSDFCDCLCANQTVSRNLISLCRGGLLERRKTANETRLVIVVDLDTVKDLPIDGVMEVRIALVTAPVFWHWMQ